MGNSPLSNLSKPNTPGLQIFIFEEKWYYIPGNWIEGVIILQLKSDVDAKEISISICGYSFSEIINVWTSTYTGGTKTVDRITGQVISDNTYTSTTRHEKKYEDNLRILQSKLIVYNGQNVVLTNKKGESKNDLQYKLAAGLYLIPFRVQVPLNILNIPGSHTGPDIETGNANEIRGTGSTFYWLEAIVERSILKSNFNASKRLNIVPFVPVGNLSGKYFEKQVNHKRSCSCLFTLCMGNQKTLINIKMMKAGVVMGEKLPFNIHVEMILPK